MKSRRLAALVLALSLTTSLFSGTALANVDEQAASSPAEVPGAPTQSATGAPDPAADSTWIASVKTQAQTIAKNRAEILELQVKLKAQTAINRNLLKKLQDSATAALVQEAKRLRDKAKQAEATIKPLREKLKALESAAKEARAARDQAKLVQLRAQALELQAQIKAAYSGDVQAARDRLKGLEAQIKQRTLQAKTLKDEIKSLSDAENTLWIMVHDLHDQKNSAWRSFSKALKATDKTGVTAALDQVIDAQKEIITQLKGTLDLKVRVQTKLDAALKSSQ